jgi:hypothetical protein
MASLLTVVVPFAREMRVYESPARHINIGKLPCVIR